MAGATSIQAVLDEVASMKRGDDLAKLVHTVAFTAADERRASLADGVAELAEREGISPEDADTRFGNVLRALERGSAEAAGGASRALLAGLLARGVALSPPSGAEAKTRVAESLLWLAANTSVDGLSAIDAALGDDAEGLWIAVAGLVRKVDAGGAPLLGRAGALLGAVALCESTSAAAHREAKGIVTEVRDPIVKSLLAGGSRDGEPSSSPSARPSSGPALVVSGEIVSAPRGPVALFLLGVCGYLAAAYVARLVGRVALRYRRPAELTASASGVTVKSRTELLGKVLREREVVIPLDSLARATREVRYPRLGLYAGLFALAMGSYFGIKNLIDGLRTVSFEIAGIGALLLAGGVALDFLLESAASGMRGKCRVVVVPRKGPTLAVGDVEPAAADAALLRLVPHGPRT
jgi:hypothetical protein